jgi:hypothetical protein
MSVVSKLPLDLDKPWVLSDSVTDDPKDVLQHQAVADALRDALESCPPDDPLGIGIYGSWGQGKTTTGLLLRKAIEGEIKAGRYAFVRIQAWRYVHEGDRQPLRRHYLLAAYEGIGRHDISSELRERFAQVITTESASPTLPSLRELGRRAWAAIRGRKIGLDSQLISIPFVGILVLVLFQGVRQELGAFLTSLIAATLVALTVATAVGNLFIKLLVGGLTVHRQEDPFRSIEQFEDEFDLFLTKHAKGYERIIFFIDDLDRCDDAVVVEALETLQAFFDRPRCAFIVAADEKQLKRAVRHKAARSPALLMDGATVPTDENFLEKIFQVAIHLPPLYTENLGDYGRSLAQQTVLRSVPADQLDHLISYLVHPGLSSPRQVKIIINQFLMAYAQALHRERADTNLAHEPLTDDPLFIAKMVVLRVHYPWFYDLLRGTPSTLIDWPLTFDPESELSPDLEDLDELVNRAASSAGEAAAHFGREAEDEDEHDDQSPTRGGPVVADRLLASLRGYLIRTAESRPVDALRVQEFIYLRSPSVFAGLTGAGGQAFRTAIANGDTGLIAEASGDHPEQVLSATKLAIQQANDGFGVERNAAHEALAALILHAQQDELSEIGVEAARVLTRGQ